jgi:type VI secretion system protein ImpI
MPKDDGKSTSSDRNKFSGRGGYFGSDVVEADSTDTTAPQQVPKPPTAPWPPIEVFPEPEKTETPQPIQPVASPQQQPADIRQHAHNDIAALYKGMGLDPALAKDATPQELEAIGARFKEMVDGVMFLLRTRAEEKVKVRVAQTIISNADVNPLKFLATSEDAILALIRGRGDSYLPGDKALTGAYRDLADHQVRTWQALQTALRRMIDRFDPEVIEREIEGAGFLEKLVAGGRNAKLWQTYQNRYREIAKAAEDKFLGEVGADFRDAYEEKRNRK